MSNISGAQEVASWKPWQREWAAPPNITGRTCGEDRRATGLGTRDYSERFQGPVLEGEEGAPLVGGVFFTH